MREAIALCEDIAGKRMNTVYSPVNRIGDHIWWVSGLQKFRSHYPGWSLTYDLRRILEEVFLAQVDGRREYPLPTPALDGITADRAVPDWYPAGGTVDGSESPVTA